MEQRTSPRRFGWRTPPSATSRAFRGDVDRSCTIPLPADWPENVKSGLLGVVDLAFRAVTFTRAWCANSPIARVRLASKLERAKTEIALLNEVIGINTARINRMSPHKRPLFLAPERLRILQLRAAHGWTLAKTARLFSITPETVAS